jgi:hypothetical protein
MIQHETSIHLNRPVEQVAFLAEIENLPGGSPTLSPSSR